MNLRKTLETLERAGTAQNREVYGRHGVGPKEFGVAGPSFERWPRGSETIRRPTGL